jgi:hypothetical protein
MADIAKSTRLTLSGHETYGVAACRTLHASPITRNQQLSSSAALHCDQLCRACSLHHGISIHLIVSRCWRH